MQCSKWQYIEYTNFSFLCTSKSTQIAFWYESIPSGNPGHYSSLTRGRSVVQKTFLPIDHFWQSIAGLKLVFSTNVARFRQPWSIDLLKWDASYVVILLKNTYLCSNSFENYICSHSFENYVCSNSFENYIWVNSLKIIYVVILFKITGRSGFYESLSIYIKLLRESFWLAILEITSSQNYSFYVILIDKSMWFM
jgi:hypothetical protein